MTVYDDDLIPKASRQSSVERSCKGLRPQATRGVRVRSVTTQGTEF